MDMLLITELQSERLVYLGLWMLDPFFPTGVGTRAASCLSVRRGAVFDWNG